MKRFRTLFWLGVGLLVGSMLREQRDIVLLAVASILLICGGAAYVVVWAKQIYSEVKH